MGLNQALATVLNGNNLWFFTDLVSVLADHAFVLTFVFQ